MSRSTAELRRLWAPGCTGPWARLSLHGEGAVTVDPLIVEAVRGLDACLRAWNYETRRADTGAYNCRGITRPDGSRDPDRLSLHAFGICLDLNWTTNPYGPTLRTDMPMAMVRAIEGIRTRGGHVVWRWGGRYAVNKDAMHYEIVASPAELALGIDPATLPGGSAGPTPTPTPTPTTPNEEQELMAAKDDILKAIDQAKLETIEFLSTVVGDVEKRLGDKLASKAFAVRRRGDRAVFVVSESGKIHVQAEELNLLVLGGLVARWPGFEKGTSTIPVVDDDYLDDLPEARDDGAEAEKPEPAKPAGTAAKAPAKKAAARKAAAPRSGE